MNNRLNSPVVTPQEFQQHVDKVGEIAFAWMNDDKVWGTSHEFYAYDIFPKLRKVETKNIYQELVKVVGAGRVKAYVWNFRKVHRQYMKELKGQSGIKSVATREAYKYVTQLQESNFNNDQEELKKLTSQELVNDFLSHERANNGAKILSTVTQRDEQHHNIMSQKSDGQWKPGFEYGAHVVEVDGEIVNPHDVFPVKHL